MNYEFSLEHKLFLSNILGDISPKIYGEEYLRSKMKKAVAMGDNKPREKIDGYDGKISRKGLSVAETQKRLNLSFRIWEEQVDYLTS